VLEVVPVVALAPADRVEEELPADRDVTVICSKVFWPWPVKSMSTIGSPVCVSKSCRVPDSFRSFPVISGTVGGV
jgi:hypothetical protein